MLLVRDLMTRSVLTLTADTVLTEAAGTLTNMGVSGAPVCDDTGHVIGVFSKSDLVTKVGVGAVQQSITVGDLMTPIVFSVRPSDLLSTAIKLMVAENVHRLMVITEDEQLVGILTPMDVLKAINEAKLTSPELDDTPRGG